MKTQIILEPTRVRRGGATFDLTLCSAETVKELSVHLKAGDCIKRARQAVKPHVIFQLQRRVAFGAEPSGGWVDSTGSERKQYTAQTSRTNNGCLLVASKTLTAGSEGFHFHSRISVYASLTERGSLYAIDPDLDICDWVEYSCRICWG
jgi:hypothetical protein